MASSPADASAAVLALQGVIACWDQGYEALARGDLDRLEALMAIADDHVPHLPTDDGGDPGLARLRSDAAASRGRLEHGMRTGLDGLREEMARARTGAKALRGYGTAEGRLGNRVESRA